MIGQEVGNYRITRELGAGGMGQVFVAEHGILGHEVAIKVLHTRYLEDEEMRARFLNEARAVAKLKHPSIVDLLDFGYLEDGSGYIIMELLSGESLRERLRAGPLELDQAAELTRQVASALHVAHLGEVIHRDLKPDNIFLVADDDALGGQRAIVLDFGLAKQVPVEPSDAEITNSGFVVGTPAYMSPEQCRGESDLDGRSDVYALGAVLYRMCTGQRPFDADSPGELLGQHLYIEPPAPRSLRAEISPALEGVILRCLAKAAADRYEDASAMATELGHLVRTPRTAVLPKNESAAEPAFVGSGSPIAPAPKNRADTTETVAGRKLAVEPPSSNGGRWKWGLALLAIVGAGAVGLWVGFPSESGDGPARVVNDAGLVLDAGDPVTIDASPTHDALTDAGSSDAGATDATDVTDATDATALPRKGRALARWVAAARRRGDSNAAYQACQAGDPEQSPALSACAIAACNVGERVQARRYWLEIGSPSIRKTTATVCSRAGVDVKE